MQGVSMAFSKTFTHCFMFMFMKSHEKSKSIFKAYIYPNVYIWTDLWAYCILPLRNEITYLSKAGLSVKQNK